MVKGVKSKLKAMVSEAAVECLKKICYTVVLSNAGGRVSNVVSRKDVKATHEQVSREEKDNLGTDNIGNKMLQGMGWREGESLGNEEAFESAKVIYPPLRIQ